MLYEVITLLVSGKPLNEPVAWYGPIVMNTQEELRIAFEEYNNGTFVKYVITSYSIHYTKLYETTTDKPVRFLLVSGKPLNEPVAWYGPIVMNTQEELRIAFEEYNNGTFVK